jgi:hypothetical protein
MDDNSKRLGALFWRLNEGQVSAHVVARLQQLCAALDAGNYPAATQIQARRGKVILGRGLGVCGAAAAGGCGAPVVVAAHGVLGCGVAAVASLLLVIGATPAR